jgi:hypothetical protein
LEPKAADSAPLLSQYRVQVTAKFVRRTHTQGFNKQKIEKSFLKTNHRLALSISGNLPLVGNF